MCAKQILPQTKKLARPDKDRSQVKRVPPPLVDSFAKAKRPRINWRMIVGTGLPCLSTYARNFGAIPCPARDWIVRVEAYVAEFATLMTEMVMTALNTEGRPWTPAVAIASTKGEALVLAPEDPNNTGEFDGTIRPKMKRLTT